jgi:hypothetical protein
MALALLTDDELAQAHEAAKSSRKIKKRLTKYRRHLKRGQRLEQALDPEAPGVVVTGTPESCEAELARRQGEALSLAHEIRTHLNK